MENDGTNDDWKDKTTRDKFLACVFLAGVDRKKYGKIISKLNNAFLAGMNNYPITIEGTVMMLSHYMSEPPSVLRSGKHEEEGTKNEKVLHNE